ncbi:MAG: cell division protein ZapA [Bacteroidales bacterium]
MKEQHISVIIADRPYRLKVSNETEEQEVRKAGDLINTKIKEYANHFAFRDKQDLLAMVVLQFAVDVVKSEESQRYQETLEQKLKNLDQLLDHYLDK